MMDEETKMWKEGSWVIDPTKSRGFVGYGAKVVGLCGERSLDYFLHFLPQSFIHDQQCCK